MRTFDYVLMICGGLILGEASAIIILNTKHGYWELTNKLHVLSAVFYLIFLTAVVYSSLQCTRSNHYCDLLWKICSTLYISMSLSVYFFYYAKSRLVNTIRWRGKKLCERVTLIGIVSLALIGLGVFWLPIEGIQWNGFLIDGECHLVKRIWIGPFWVAGDTILSFLLL